MTRVDCDDNVAVLEAVMRAFLHDCFWEKPPGFQNVSSNNLAERSCVPFKSIDRPRQTGLGFELQVPSYTLSDVALNRSTLRSIEVTKRRFQVNARMQASARLLFHGLPGTGKTMAAEALAGDLGREFIIMSGGEIEDKYFGESEKKLSRVFELVRDSDAVLVLDEVDSLLKRRDQASHDHYANLTNHLLRLLEAGGGVVVLCTNHLQGLDPAVLRRMTQRIEFCIPDAEARAGIWRLHLGEESEATRLAMAHFLGVFPLTGGLIKNAAEHAYAERDFRKGSYLRLKDLLIAVGVQLEEMRYMLQQYNVQISIGPSGGIRPVNDSELEAISG